MSSLIAFPSARTTSPLPSQVQSEPATPPPTVPGRYAPPDYTLQVASRCGRAVALYNPDSADRYYAIGFIGKSAKSAFHLSFRTIERRAEYIATWLADHTTSFLAEDTRKAEKKARRATWQHGLTVGTILHYSWGYDQTQADFWQVVAVQGKAVLVREIASKMVEGGGTAMAGYCLPCPGVWKNDKPASRKIPQPSSAKDGDCCLKMHCGHAYPVNPSEPKYCSWYA